eukprot:4125292-Pyramimonas_sp.AAC.2
MATRVAMERGEELRRSVGYHVRLEKHPPHAHGGILFCTTGMLVRRFQVRKFEFSSGGAAYTSLIQNAVFSAAVAIC